MKLAFIVAGAADMYCGSCLRDSALATGLRQLGQDVTVIPTYTPLRLDGEPTVDDHVYFGGVEVFLADKLAAVRTRRGWLARLLGAQTILRWLGRTSVRTDPSKLGHLACSVLRGEEGNQKRLLEELVDFLEHQVRPDLVHLPNSLYAGFARLVHARLGVPVCCGLAGEDLFLSQLREPHRSEALALLRERARDVDAFIAGSQHCATYMSQWAGLDAEKISVVLPGIPLDGFPGEPPGSDRAAPLTVGFFARIAPEKGLHYLARAFRELCRSGEFPGLRLKVAGYLGVGETRYAAAVRKVLAQAGLTSQVEFLGTVDREDKLDFFRSLDVLSVPTDYPEPKGLFVFEAFAAGVPVVLPDHGAFPEYIEAAGAGLLHKPRDPADLAAQLAVVLRDSALRRELGAKGHRAARERFFVGRMAQETLRVYENLLGQEQLTSRGCGT